MESLQETPKAAAAFIAYRDFGAERSLVKVCHSLGKKPGYVVQLQEWSAKYAWQSRCAAYDAAQREQEKAQLEAEEAIRRKRKIARDIRRDDARARMDDERADIFRGQWAKTLKLINEKAESGDVKGIMALTALLNRALDEERQSLGSPTQSIAIMGKDGGPIETTDVTFDLQRRLSLLAAARRANAVSDESESPRVADTPI